MSDIVVVTGSVDISGANVRFKTVQLYETIDKGMGLVNISGQGRWGDNATQTGANFDGVALQAGVSGDWITTVRGGNITLGPGTASSGELYGFGTGNGGIADITGLTTNNWVSVIGYGVNDDVIFVNPVVTNTQRQ